MSKIAWAILIGLILVVLLALGAVWLLPFWARGLGVGMMRPGIIGGLVFPFFLMRGFGFFLFWLLIIVGVILLFRATPQRAETSAARIAPVESPLEILQRRYTRGEITNGLHL